MYDNTYLLTGSHLRKEPPCLSFRCAEKKDSAAYGVRKKRAPAWSQVTACGQNHIRRHPNAGMLLVFQCSLPLWYTDLRSYFLRTGGSAQAHLACSILSSSRGLVRGIILVKSTTERQRYAGAAATRTCAGGDPGSALRLPSLGRSPEDPSSGRLSLECKNRFFPRTGKKWFFNTPVTACKQMIL